MHTYIFCHIRNRPTFIVSWSPVIFENDNSRNAEWNYTENCQKKSKRRLPRCEWLLNFRVIYWNRIFMVHEFGNIRHCSISTWHRYLRDILWSSTLSTRRMSRQGIRRSNSSITYKLYEFFLVLSPHIQYWLCSYPFL